jgi:hypothetical protein
MPAATVAASPFSNGVAAIVFNRKLQNPMHTSSTTPAADAGKPTNDVTSTAPGQAPHSPQTVNASADALECGDSEVSYRRLPTLAEAKVYWVLSRS